MATADVQVARVIDTRLEALSNNQVAYVVEEGASVTSYVPITSSSHSNSNTVFNLNNIAERTCRDSRMVLNLTVTATLNCTNTTGGNLYVVQADNFGKKQYPLNRCINSLQHQINQASITINTNDIIDMIARVNLLPEEANFYEDTMPDFVDSYQNATGSNFNPLEPYSNTHAGDGIYKPRTSNFTVAGNQVLAGATSNVVITCNFYEPLISPFNNIGKKNEKGLYAINGEIINISWISGLFDGMFSFYAPAGITVNSKTVSLGASAVLNCIYLTPPDSLIPSIPQQSVYQYNDFQVFSNSLGACAAGALVGGGSISSQVVSFTNVPQKIIIACRLSNSARTSATPDKYLTAENLSLSFDNGAPQLSSANARQFYDISARNGLSMPVQAFLQQVLNPSLVAGGATPLYGCGSVLVIDPALDLGLTNVSTSSAGKFVFQVQQANFRNRTSTAFSDCTLYVIGVSTSVLERIGSQYRNYNLTIPDDASAKAKQLSPISHQEYMNGRHSNLFLGAGIGDWFKKAYNKAKSVIQYGLRNKEKLQQAYEKGKEAYDVAKSVLDAQKARQEAEQMQGQGRVHFGHSVTPRKRMDLFYN